MNKIAARPSTYGASSAAYLNVYLKAAVGRLAVVAFFACGLIGNGLVATTASAATEATDNTPDRTSDSDKAICLELVKLTSRVDRRSELEKFCERVQKLPTCVSREGRPIFHVEKESTDKRGKRILALGLIHGDEPLAGELTLGWAERLAKLEKHRSTWRIVPLLNPDGLIRKTRPNAAGVDLNRNFPTRDWNNDAKTYWEQSQKRNDRRFPGDAAASEPETKCVIAQIKDFKPDFIVSNHTPYRVLDFDGPKMKFPKYKDLPWRALGNFPGSLGRYMWHDYKIPVLTVELGEKMVDADELQDLIGTFALEAVRLSGDKSPDLYDLL